MKIFSKTLRWIESNNNWAYSFIRIFLGVALFVRGLVLISDPEAITQLAGAHQWYWWYAYITIAHLIGGLSLAFGLFTRYGALLQIPILFGAVFIVHFKQGLMTGGQSLELSALVLVLLLIYFVFGSGVLAVDNYITKRRSARNPVVIDTGKTG